MCALLPAAGANAVPPLMYAPLRFGQAPDPSHRTHPEGHVETNIPTSPFGTICSASVPVAAVAEAALCAWSASTANGTAPTFVRPSDIPPSRTSTHTSAFALTAATHASGIGTEKRPCSSVTDCEFVVHSAAVPPAATSHNFTSMLCTPLRGVAVASSS